MAQTFSIKFVAFILFVGIFASAASCDRANLVKNTSETMLSIETAQGSSKFQVELARTSEEQRVGLMFRRELASNAGMLFDYRPAPSHQSIWMKNTLIPLDVLFVDEKGIIVTVYENATPRSLESMPSRKPVIAVLELNGGTLKSIGAKVGDKINHVWFEGK